MIIHWFSIQAAVVLLNGRNRLLFMTGAGACLLPGSNSISKWLSSLKSQRSNKTTSQWQSLQFGYWNAGMPAGSSWASLSPTQSSVTSHGPTANYPSVYTKASRGTTCFWSSLFHSTNTIFHSAPLEIWYQNSTQVQSPLKLVHSLSTVRSLTVYLAFSSRRTSGHYLGKLHRGRIVCVCH